jgi:hypothetical protein
MRPLAVLIGIVFGSVLSLAIGLAMTWIVLLFLPEHAEAFAVERSPLLHAIALFSVTAVAAGVGLYGELRTRSWRFIAHTSIVALLGFVVWIYWPR